MPQSNLEPFTVEQALTIQAKHILKWKRLLKEEFHAKLDAKVLHQNEELKHWVEPIDGHYVWLGEDIDLFVINLK